MHPDRDVPMSMRMSFTAYAVQLEISGRLASGDNAGPMLINKWKDAHAYRRGLLAHRLKGRVVKVDVVVSSHNPSVKSLNE